MIGKVIKPKIDRTIKYNIKLYLVYLVFIIIFVIINIFYLVYYDLFYYLNFKTICVAELYRIFLELDKSSKIIINLPTTINNYIYLPYEYILNNKLYYLIYVLYNLILNVLLFITFLLFYIRGRKINKIYAFSDNDISDEELKYSIFNYNNAISYIFTMNNSINKNCVTYFNLNSFTILTLTIYSIIYFSNIFKFFNVYDSSINCYVLDNTQSLFEIFKFSNICGILSIVIFLVLLFSFIVVYGYDYKPLPKIKIFIIRYKKLINIFLEKIYNKKYIEDNIINKNIYTYEDKYINIIIKVSLNKINILFKDQKQDLIIDQIPDFSIENNNVIRDNRDKLKELIYTNIDEKFSPKNDIISLEREIFFVKEKTKISLIINIILFILFIIFCIIIIPLIIIGIGSTILLIINKNNIFTFKIDNIYIYYFILFIILSLILDIIRLILYIRYKKVNKVEPYTTISKKTIDNKINNSKLLPSDKNIIKTTNESRNINNNNISVSNINNVSKNLTIKSQKSIINHNISNNLDNNLHNISSNNSVIFSKIEDNKVIKETDLLYSNIKEKKKFEHQLRNKIKSYVSINEAENDNLNNLNISNTSTIKNNLENDINTELKESIKYKREDFRNKKFNTNNIYDHNIFLKPKFDLNYVLENKDINKII